MINLAVSTGSLNLLFLYPRKLVVEMTFTPGSGHRSSGKQGVLKNPMSGSKTSTARCRTQEVRIGNQNDK
ncbi:hypothetical protein C6502_02785 [Candidatus Poribacteria bacterium]|nr:MAG: hypothetical protein C6502_02785 [Candidatus Poribacteria bacterium]